MSFSALFSLSGWAQVVTLPIILHAQLDVARRMLVWEARDQDFRLFGCLFIVLSFLFISSFPGQDIASWYPASSHVKSVIVRAHLLSHGFWEPQRKSGI